MTELQRLRMRAEMARKAARKLIAQIPDASPGEQEALTLQAASRFQQARDADRDAERAYNAELIAALG